MFCRYCNEIRSATLTRSVTIRKPTCKTVYHRAWWRWCANSGPWCRERDEEWPRSCSNATEDPVIVLKYMRSVNPFFGCANSPRQWNKGTNIRNSETKRRTNFRLKILSSIYISEWGSGCSGTAASTIDKILIINRYPVCLFHELSFQPTKKASIAWFESKVGYISRIGRKKPGSDFKNR